MSKKQTKMSFSDFQRSTLPSSSSSSWGPAPTATKQQQSSNKSSNSAAANKKNTSSSAGNKNNKQKDVDQKKKQQASSSTTSTPATPVDNTPTPTPTTTAQQQQQQSQQSQQKPQQQKSSSTGNKSSTTPPKSAPTTAAAAPAPQQQQQQSSTTTSTTSNQKKNDDKKSSSSSSSTNSKNKKSDQQKKSTSSTTASTATTTTSTSEEDKVDLFYKMPQDMLPLAKALKQQLHDLQQQQQQQQSQKQQGNSTHQKSIDEPILNYLSCVLHGQNDASTRTMNDRDIVSLVATYVQEMGLLHDTSSSLEWSQHMLQHMYDHQLVQPPPQQQNQHGGSGGGEHVKELSEAISLGRQFEEQQKQNQIMMDVATGSSVPSASSINFNEQLDWEKRMSKLRAEKQAKRDAKERDAKMAEYEEYLKRRGLSNSRGIVKMHNADQVTGTRDVVLHNISVAVGNQELLSDSDFVLHCGHRYGLIGRNGVGKTTLLRHFVERDLPGIPPYLQILHIEQEVTGDETTAIESVLKTDVERLSLLAEEKKLLEDGGSSEAADERLTEIYARMDEIDAHSAESRAAAILSGLQFTTEMQNMKTKDFSGGWRMRIALARALFVEPDILLLDEPTNHLDLAAVLWLENYLIKWKKTLVVVSHARSFLNNVVTDIIHFHEKQLHYYRGDYNTFEKTRLDALKLQQKTFEAQEKQRKHIQSFIDRFRYKTATAKMVQSRIKMLEKMEFVAAVAEDPTFTFTIPSPEAEAPPYLQAVDVTFGFSEQKILFKKLNFNLDMDSRIALVGPNGAGKTTFMHVLMGDLKPLEGYVNLNRKLRIARFNQHHIEQLDLRLTPLEYMQAKYEKADPQELRSHLGGLGLSGNLATQPIYTLSGGQKSRVSFAELTFMKPHLLLLDEPTNHLDIDSVDALIQALNEYGGGILVISHDEHLIKTVCDEIWVCQGGEITKFDGTFDDYKKSLEFK